MSFHVANGNKPEAHADLVQTHHGVAAESVAADATAIDVHIADAAGTDPLTFPIKASEAAGGNCSGAPIDWLGVDPMAGTIDGGEHVDALVVADPAAAALPTGDFAAELCVTTNDPDQNLVSIPVSLTVTPANDVFCSGFESGESGTCAP
jgi:hypothetical protein